MSQKPPLPEKPSPAARTVTIRDVATLAGVGLGTVSRYVNQSGPVGPAARERIREAIATLGYHANANASALRRGNSKLIGVLLPDLDNAAFPPMVRAIDEAARADGYALIVTAGDRVFSHEAEAISALMSRRVAGLIMIPTTESSEELARAIGNDTTPVVLLDRELLAGRANTGRILVRHDAGTETATRYLLDAGERRLLLLHAGDNRAARSREAGFRRALAEVPSATGTILMTGRSCEATQESLGNWLATNPIPDAIVVGHNRMLTGTLTTLVAKGLRVGKDISLVTSDRTELSAFYDPPIACIDRKADEIGARAYAMLQALTGAPGSLFEDEVTSIFVPAASIRGCGDAAPRIPLDLTS